MLPTSGFGISWQPGSGGLSCDATSHGDPAPQGLPSHLPHNSSAAAVCSLLSWVRLEVLPEDADQSIWLGPSGHLLSVLVPLVCRRSAATFPGNHWKCRFHGSSPDLGICICHFSGWNTKGQATATNSHILLRVQEQKWTKDSGQGGPPPMKSWV